MNAPLTAPEKPQLRQEPAAAPGSPTSRKDEAKILRGHGLSYGKIARRLGEREGTVYRWLNEDAVAVYRARERERQRTIRAEAAAAGEGHLSPEMRAWVARRKREIAGKALTRADKEQLARAMDDVGGA